MNLGHPFRDIACPASRAEESRRSGCSATPSYGAQVAAYSSLPYCFAHFITDGRGAEQALGMYREQYRPSSRPLRARRPVRLGGRGDNREGSRARLCTSRELWRLHREAAGIFTALPCARNGGIHAWGLRMPKHISIRAAPSSTRFTGRLQPWDDACVRWHMHGVERSDVGEDIHKPIARRTSYTSNKGGGGVPQLQLHIFGECRRHSQALDECGSQVVPVDGRRAGVLADDVKPIWVPPLRRHDFTAWSASHSTSSTRQLHHRPSATASPGAVAAESRLVAASTVERFGQSRWLPAFGHCSSRDPGSRLDAGHDQPTSAG